MTGSLFYTFQSKQYPFTAELTRFGPTMGGLCVYSADIIDHPQVTDVRFCFIEEEDVNKVEVVANDKDESHVMFIGHSDLYRVNGKGSKILGSADYPEYAALVMMSREYGEKLSGGEDVFTESPIAWDANIFPKLMTAPASYGLMDKPFYLPVVPSAGIYVPICVEPSDDTLYNTYTYQHGEGAAIDLGTFPHGYCTLADLRTAWLEWFEANDGGSYSGFHAQYKDPVLEDKMRVLNGGSREVLKYSNNQLALLNRFYRATRGISFYSLITAPTSGDEFKLGWQ